MMTNEFEGSVGAGAERFRDARVVCSAGAPNRRLRLLVLGVGNILMTDDGIGVHAVNALRKKPRAGVLVTEVGTALLDAVPLLCWASRVIVIDALHGNEPPGSLYFATLSELLDEQSRLSLHELDLFATLALMPHDVRKPEIFVLGVQPSALDMGLQLSGAVAASIPKIERFVDERILEWRRERVAQV